MSLETEISKLTQVVIALTDRLSALEGRTEQKTEPKPEPKPGVAKVKREPVKEEQESNHEPVKTEDEKIDRQSIVDLCMSIVKADRSKGKAIKEVFASFGGATLVSDVAEKDLASLKAKIEELQ